MFDFLIAPFVLCFILGFAASLIKSDLRLPESTFQFISIYLLLAIGLKGGQAFQNYSGGEIGWLILGVLLLGVLTTLISFWLFMKLFKFGWLEACALAAHFGCISAVTYVAAQSALDHQGLFYEGYFPALVAVMEVPALLIAMVLISRARPKVSWWKSVREALVGKSVLLLLGGFLIGYLAQAEHYKSLEFFFVKIFPGFLCIFMLELGVIAGLRSIDIKTHGLKLVMASLFVSVLNGLIGLCVGLGLHYSLGLSEGGVILFAVLCGSCSYIAAPAAIKQALPEASPGLYLTASLGVVFPFNILVGIPFYVWLTQALVK